jgi:flagellar biosynthesis protein FlhA
MLAISTGIIVTRVFDGSPDTVTEGIFKELLAHLYSIFITNA